MKLHSLFEEGHVLVGCETDSFADVLGRLLDTFKEDLSEEEHAEILTGLLAREEATPSLLEGQVCAPHLRREGLRRLLTGVAILENPVVHPQEVEPGNEANDEAPHDQSPGGGASEGELSDGGIKIVFLLAAPPQQNTMMLQTLAAIERLVSTKAFASGAGGVRSAARFLRIVEESGLDVRRTLSARDIMEPIDEYLKLDTTLIEAVAKLAVARDEGLPVLDERGHLAGELTTREVLLLGMPNYLELLSNPDMLNAFEAFENYFENEHKLFVRDICRRDFLAVVPATPIVEVAHLMITKNVRRVYVVDDEKILGVIFRKSILTRVLTY